LPFDAWVAKHDPEGQLLWRRRLGTSADDQARGVATDKRGNVFVAGWTLGSLGGPSKGDADAWLAKYDADGRLKWKRQLGTSGYDVALAVATGPSGNVVIAGSVGLAKYDADGHLLWWRQPPTGGAAVAVDKFGSVVTAGGVAKYDSAGHLKWRQKPDSTQRSKGVAIDGRGNIVIVGDRPDSGYGDAWVAKYDADGHPLWTRQIATGEWEAAPGGGRWQR
jgi:Beta-propeller repeat